MRYIKRRLTAKIEHSLTVDRVTALMGPRQAGKTTLVRHLLQSEKELVYYNLKDPAVRKTLQENAKQEFDYYRNATIVLDEVQTVPSLLEQIQLQVDETPEIKGRFLLLGSNHLLLNRHIKESLAGRVTLFSLLPLGIGEIEESTKPTLLDMLLAAENHHGCTGIINNFYLPSRLHEKKQNTLMSLNRFGGYPEFLTRKEPDDRIAWLNSYHQTYLETDLRQLVELRNPESFEIFERLFVQRIGGLMNIAELGRDCGLSADTIRRFIGYYRQLFITWRAKPYHTNPGKRMMKMSKYYFYDTGLLRAIPGDFSTLSGHFFENTVLAEIKKILSFYQQRDKLYFARTSTGVEVDGCIPALKGDFFIFLEIKQSETHHNHHIRHLKKYIKTQENSIGILVNNSISINQLTEKIWSIPASWLLG